MIFNVFCKSPHIDNEMIQLSCRQCECPDFTIVGHTSFFDPELGTFTFWDITECCNCGNMVPTPNSEAFFRPSVLANIESDLID